MKSGGWRRPLPLEGAGIFADDTPPVVVLRDGSDALFFGVINAIVALVLALLCAGRAFGLASIGVEWNVAAPWGDAIPMVPSLAVILFFILNGLYTCAIAVPMTAASFEATPNDRSADPLFGIGRGMFSLALIWILWLVAIYFSGLIQLMIEQLTYILHLALGQYLTLTPIKVPQYNLVGVLLSMLFLFWGTCWYYATAIIAWSDEVTAREARRVVTREVSRMSADDLRALRESRMQK